MINSQLMRVCIALLVLTVSNNSYADLSANIGLASDYYFRGMRVKEGATASAGIDFEKGRYYVGGWFANVEKGIEADFYAGVNGYIDLGVSYSIGISTYQFTANNDAASNELNTSIVYSLFALELSLGKQNEVDEGDYIFTGLTAEKYDFYFTVGKWLLDFDGSYLELGWLKEFSFYDIGLALIVNSKELSSQTNTGDERLILSLGKTFDL